MRSALTFNNKSVFFIILIFTFLLYGNTIMHKYALDDSVVIKYNNFTKQGISGIPDIFTTDSFKGYFKSSSEDLLAGGRYRPLSIAFFALEFQFFGMNPHLSHFINILIYFFTGWLIYLIIKNFSSEWIQKKIPDKTVKTPHNIFALTVALLFIAHPLHTEVVANIKGRDEIMSFLGSLAAMYFLLNYKTNKGFQSLLLSFLCFLGALLSKENAITFVAVIPLTVYFFSPKTNQPKGFYKDLLIITGTLLLSSAVFLAIRFFVLGPIGEGAKHNIMNNPFVFTSINQKYATIFYTLGLYIKLLFFPHPLTVDYYPYHIPIVELVDIKSLSGIFIYLALGVAAVIGFKKKTVYSYGILIFLICLSIVSNIFFTVGTFMNERFVYFSSLGFSLILAFVLVYKLPNLFPTKQNPDIPKNKFPLPIPVSIFLLIILIAFSLKTINRNKDWESDLTLFSQDVKTSHNSAFSNKSVANHLIETALSSSNTEKKKDLLAKAIKHLSIALDIYPNYKQALFLMGNAYYLYNKDYKKSWEYYSQLLFMDPDHKDVHQNLPIVLAECKNPELRMKIIEELLHIAPNEFYVNYYMGREMRMQKNTQAAELFLLKALNKKPLNTNALLELGIVYGLTGDLKKSLQIHERVNEITPENLSIVKNLIILYQKLGDTANAKKYQLIAEQLKQK